MSVDEGLLAGRYQRGRTLGRGGMGEVWLAEDLLLGRNVAIKRLRIDLDDLGSTAVDRVVREAKLAARLHHPFAVTTFDLIMEAGRPHVVMEYVEGETLDELIRRHGRIDLFEAARLMSEVAQALAAAHRSGIIHRDIKPANIIVNEDHHAKLADFGIARGIDDWSLTGTGQLIGTIAFMAPEVAAGGVASVASDIWSLGATLYAAVEGHAPYDIDRSQNVLAILTRIATKPVPTPPHAGPLSGLLTSMLATEPALRPAADTVARGLSQVLVEHAVSAKDPLRIELGRVSPDDQSAVGVDSIDDAEPTKLRTRPGASLEVEVGERAVQLGAGASALVSAAGDTGKPFDRIGYRERSSGDGTAQKGDVSPLRPGADSRCPHSPPSTNLVGAA
jgi:serine/threonine protein kinase